MSTVFTFFISTITLKSMCISIALILAGLLGILLVAMLCNDAVQPYNPDEKNTSPDTEYGIEALLDCNIWEWLLLICGGMIVGPNKFPVRSVYMIEKSTFLHFFLRICQRDVLT